MNAPLWKARTLAALLVLEISILIASFARFVLGDILSAIYLLGLVWMISDARHRWRS